MGLPSKQTTSAKALDVTFTIAVEDTNAIAVAAKVRWINGQAVDRRINLRWYLSADANGDAIAAVPDGGIAIGTDGLLIENTANQSGMLTTEADGDFDVVITESTARTMYLVVVLPTGDIVVSGAITFA